MKIAFLIARILLGLVFVVFGLNGFLQFLPMPPQEGIAGNFLGTLVQSHYIAPVMLIQVIGGVLLLAGIFVPLALVLLGPVIVNILMFHITMAPSGLPLAFIAAVLWFIVFAGVRHAFDGIFAARAATPAR